MLDFKFIKDNADQVKDNSKRRNVKVDVDLVVELYGKRNALQQRIDNLRQSRNENAQKMKGKLDQKQKAEFIQEGKELKETIAQAEVEYRNMQNRLFEEAAKVPNMTHPEVPLGNDESANREIKRWGTVPKFDFKYKDHLELGKDLDLIDFESAQDVAGQKFYYLKNQAVILELALVRYALDILQKQGFVPFITPDIAREDIAAGLGFNPRGEESNIYTLEDTGMCLIGTAEITLGGYYAKRIMDAVKLPVKLAGFSHCFRREAGAAGQYSKGLYRVHQFSKLEMFIICLPEQSEVLHNHMLELEEMIYQGLGIPYRVVDVCTGDLGNQAFRKFDIEAWMPGRGENGEWGEITSTSNCTDFQARRLQIRTKQGGENIFVHMLNGTAIAVSRTLIALLENFQTKEGEITIPQNLITYTGFSKITKS
ncbi:MAG: serine--tRNA ligase [Spirochaetales bacterium]|nr:serine--tRNA ligase [Spirochaetales bacterium]